MTRKVASSKRSIPEAVTRPESDNSRVTQTERLAALEERAERELREHEVLTAIYSRARGEARETDDDVTRTRAALYYAAALAHRRAIVGPPDPHIVRLRAEIDRYLDTRTDGERDATHMEIPLLVGQPGGKRRAERVLVLAEDVKRVVAFCEHALPAAQSLEERRKLLDTLASWLVRQAERTGLGSGPIKTRAVEALARAMLIAFERGALETHALLKRTLRAIGVSPTDAQNWARVW